LREVIGLDDTHRYLIQNRDSIFAKQMDASIKALGVVVPAKSVLGGLHHEYSMAPTVA
jgi:hypothetical protein